MEAHEQKFRVHKLVTLLGITRRSSLNLRWGKCGIWLVNQWVPTFLCVSVCLNVDYTLRVLDIIIFDACLVIVFVWGIDMLIILIDPFAYPHILTLLVVWSLCSPWHVHYSCCLSRSFWHDCFSWLYIIMIVIEYAILARYSSRLACVWTWMIYLHFAWLPVAWLLFFYVISCFLSVWIAHLSFYLQPFGFDHFLHFGSYFGKCEALCVLVFLTELEVKSRV